MEKHQEGWLVEGNMNYAGNYKLIDILPGTIKNQIDTYLVSWINNINDGYNIFDYELDLGSVEVTYREDK